MRLWCRREFIARATAWRNAEESRLAVECRILEAMLRASRDELAEVRNLHGRKLMARFGWVAVDEIDQLIREQQEFLNECSEIWIEGSISLAQNYVVLLNGDTRE